MSNVQTFNGFPYEAFDFLRDLARNNTTEWFNTHRGQYDEYVLEPSRLFVTALGEKLRKIVPEINADPRVNRSLFRINRDTRFSPDKRPYKTHAGILFWDGNGKRMETSGFYVHLEPDNVFLGVGMHMFPKTFMSTYRDYVAEKIHGAALRKAIDKVSASGPYEIGGQSYKRVPRGYDPSYEYADLLMYGGIWAGFHPPTVEAVYESGFTDFCMAHFTNMLPLHVWLRKIA